jgi:hypothetical protein
MLLLNWTAYPRPGQNQRQTYLAKPRIQLINGRAASAKECAQYRQAAELIREVNSLMAPSRVNPTQRDNH